MGLAKMSQKVDSNGSGSWQKDVSQNIVKGWVFLGAATVHWDLQKMRENHGAGEEDSDKRVQAIISCH